MRFARHIKGKLDDEGGSEAQLRRRADYGIYERPNGRLCDWGILRTECWGVRLPSDYHGNVPPQMVMAIDIPEPNILSLNMGHSIMNRRIAA